MQKKIKQGKWELNHERYIDDMGFERDRFDLFDTEQRVHRPFLGSPKVSNKPLDFPINKIPYEYTQEDYEEILKEQIENI